MEKLITDKRRDLRSTLLFLAWLCFMSFYGLGALEFFRHTEADRSLIAWQMLESGDYLVPQLLHSPVLTKPPLFYCLLALCFKLTASVSEFTARIPSALAAMAFSLLQFCSLRRLRFSFSESLSGAAILSSLGGFLILSGVAEIDMFHALLSALSLYLFYFALLEQRGVLLILAFLLLGLACLTKGPIAICLLLAAGGTLLISERRVPEFLKKPQGLLAVFLGLFVIAVLLGSWCYLLARQVGAGELLRQFQVEFLDRALKEDRHNRGPFFSLLDLLPGLFPWSLISLYCLLVYLRREGFRAVFRRFKPSGFAKANLALFLPALLIFSLAQGKSSRYLFPVYFAAANLIFLLLRQAGKDRILPAFSKLIPTVLVLLILVKVVLVHLWVPYRNEERSVQGIVREIKALLPQEEVLYQIEMFDRWINFYLKKSGRETYRLTPERSLNPHCPSGRCYIFLSKSEEAWRVKQLASVTSELKIEAEFTAAKDKYLLLSVTPQALAILNPSPYFPTKASPPQL